MRETESVAERPLAERPLAERFRAGEEQAIREVHARYAGPVSTVARSMVGDPQLVAEVVQQTFVKAWRASSTFDQNRDLAPWLYSIARRAAIDVLRREGRIGERTTELDEQQAAPASISFERTWEVWEIRQAIDDLPSGEREVLRLSHFAGLTHQEIAERMGIPAGTVKSRSARAYQRLAAALRHLERMDEPATTSANQRPESVVEGGEDR